MAFCKQCGAELTPANRFCPKCGAPTGQNPTTGNSAQGTYAPQKKAEVNFSEIGSKIADAGAKIITNVSERASGTGATTLQKPTSGFPLIYAALAGMVATLVLSFTKIINFGYFFYADVYEDEDLEYNIGRVTLGNMTKFMNEDGEEIFGVLFGIATVLGVILMLAGIAFLLLPKLTRKNATALNAIIPMITLVLFVIIQKAITIASCAYVLFEAEQPLYTNNSGVLFYGVAIATFIMLISLLKENKQNSSNVPANALKKPSKIKVSLSNSDGIFFWGCFGLVVLTLLCNCLSVYKLNTDEESLLMYLSSSFEDVGSGITSLKLDEISTLLKECVEMDDDLVFLNVIGEFILRVGPVLAVIGAVKMLVDKLTSNKFSTADALLPAVGIILTIVNKLGSLIAFAIRVGEFKNRVFGEFSSYDEDMEDFDKFGSISFGLILFLIVAVITVIGLIKLSKKIKAEKAKVSQEAADFADQVPYQDAYGAAQPAQDFTGTIQ